jgi:hypothetical protein
MPQYRRNVLAEWLWASVVDPSLSFEVELQFMDPPRSTRTSSSAPHTTLLAPCISREKSQNMSLNVRIKLILFP